MKARWCGNLHCYNGTAVEKQETVPDVKIEQIFQSDGHQNMTNFYFVSVVLSISSVQSGGCS